MIREQKLAESLHGDASLDDGTRGRSHAGSDHGCDKCAPGVVAVPGGDRTLVDYVKRVAKRVI